MAENTSKIFLSKSPSPCDQSDAVSATVEQRSSSSLSTPTSSIDIVPIEAPDADDISLDFDISSHLNDLQFRMTDPLAREDMDTVVFTNDEDFYPHSFPVKCHFTVYPGLEIKRNDIIAILPLNFNPSEWKLQVVASVSAFDCETEECPYLLRKVTFPREKLAEVSLNLPYQFVYIDEVKGPIEKSRPFIFREAISEDFVEVLECPTQDDKDSFVVVKDYQSVLWDRVRQLMGKNAALENDRRMLEKALKERNGEVEYYKKLEEGMTNCLEKGKEKYEVLLREKQEIENQMKELKAHMVVLQDAHNKLEETHQERSSEHQKLNQEFARIKNELSQASQEKADLQDALNELKHGQVDMVPKATFQNALDNNRDLKFQIHLLTEKVEKFEAENSVLKRSLDAAHATINNYSNQDNDRLQNIAALSGKLELLEIQNKILEQDKEKLTENFKSSRETIKKLRDSLTNATGEVDFLKKIVDDRNSNVTEVEELLARKDSEIKNLQNAHEKLTKETQLNQFAMIKEQTKLKNEIKELRSKMSISKKAWEDVNRETSQLKLKSLIAQLGKLNTRSDAEEIMRDEAESLHKLSSEMDYLLAQVLESRDGHSSKSMGAKMNSQSTFSSSSPYNPSGSSSLSKTVTSLNLDIPSPSPSVTVPKSFGHNSKLGEDLISVTKKSVTSSSDESISCPECSKPFPQNDRSDQFSPLLHHLESDHNRSICPFCGMAFPKVRDLIAFKSHVDSHFAANDPYEFD